MTKLERQTISIEKLFSNQSVQEYAGYIKTILEDNKIELIELIHNYREGKYFAIVKINMEADAAFMMDKKIKFVDKEFYLQVASEKETYYLV